MLLLYWKNFIILKLKIFIEKIAYFVCLILLLIILQAWFITFNLLVKSYSSTDSKSFCNLQHVFILKHFFMFLKETKMSPKIFLFDIKIILSWKQLRCWKPLKKKKKLTLFPLKVRYKFSFYWRNILTSSEMASEKNTNNTSFICFLSYIYLSMVWHFLKPKPIFLSHYFSTHLLFFIENAT